MDRRTVTTLARHLGAKIIFKDSTITAYEFQSEDELLDFREMIPFLTLWTSEFKLNVYFDQLSEKAERVLYESGAY